MDLNSARYNMVHQQVRPWDVSNPKILELLFHIPRERFVPAKFQHLAFSDTAIPIGDEQMMLPPKTVGRLLQALNLNVEMRVLEVGTGTGYITALLSQLVKEVVSLEIFPDLSERAKDILYSLNIHNVTLKVGDAVSGWPNELPYDAIIFTGSLPSFNHEQQEALSKQLSEGGKIFAILGVAPAMTAVVFHKKNGKLILKQTLFETVVPALLNAPPSNDFIL